MKFGQENFTIKLKCKGSTSSITIFTDAFQTKTELIVKEQLVTLSVDHLTADHLLTWTTTERMLFLQNRSNRKIRYIWSNSYVEGVLKAEVLQPNGALEPKESHAIRIKISAFDLPCQMRINIPCELYDLTQEKLHEESVAEFQLKNETIKDEFTITEKGIERPVSKPC